MNKFYKNVLVFSATLFVVLLCIECLLLSQPNIYSYKCKFVETHLQEIKVILLGNSHIDQGLDPKWIGDSTFNLAIQGRSRIYDVELAKKYFPQMENLEVVIMPLDYFDFILGREKKNNIEINKKDEKYASTYKCMYYKYMGIHIDGWWYWSEILNSRLNYMTRFFLTEEKSRGCDSLGYVKCGIENRKQGWKYARIPEYIDTSKDVDEKMYSMLVSCYETLARISYHQGLRLILITPPVYETYQKRMNKFVSIEMSNFYKQLNEKYPNVEYYDFSHDDRFIEDDFYDASHLSDSGAKKFSILVSEIVQEAPY